VEGSNRRRQGKGQSKSAVFTRLVLNQTEARKIRRAMSLELPAKDTPVEPARPLEIIRMNCKVHDIVRHLATPASASLYPHPLPARNSSWIRCWRNAIQDFLRSQRFASRGASIGVLAKQCLPECGRARLYNSAVPRHRPAAIPGSR